MNLPDHPLTEAAAQLASGQTTGLQLTEACLERQAQCADSGAYLLVDGDGAKARAKDLDRVPDNDRGALHGIPIALKDIILTKGHRTTCASKILENFVAPYDATVARRLHDAGAITLGKLNMDEFAMGSSNEHSAFGKVRNPWDPNRVPGGSSGGSAAAVAEGSCFGALGTDTGGSIRQPAAFCGIVGLKPTYGRVSRYGVIAFASSLDQVGPMARNVGDCAALYHAIAGHDPHDATSAEQPVEAPTLSGDVQGLRIGIPKEYFIEGIQPQVQAAVQAAIDQYKSMGAEIIEVSLPHTAHAIATYYLICTAEASSNLARFDGVRYGARAPQASNLQELYTQTRGEFFGDEVKRRIVLGTYVLSSGYYDAYYLKAQQVRTLICRDFEAAFQKVDLIATPTTPTTAFPVGQNADDPMTMYLADIFTVSANLAGLPGLSLPCGFDDDGLPIGLQLLGPHWSEAKVLDAAHAYEQTQSWHTRRPTPPPNN